MLLSSGIDGPRVHAINVYVFSARASLVSPLACFLGFSYSLTSRFMVAFTSGRVVGSPCPPRRMRAVASVLPSVPTRCSRYRPMSAAADGRPAQRCSRHQLVKSFQPAT